MTLVLSTLERLAFLFSFIVLGFVLAKLKAVPENSDTVLSRLETNLFTPCLTMGTFIKSFTTETLINSWKPIAVCSLVLAVTLPLAIFLGKLFSKDSFTRNIYTYGFCFSNFGFMGLAVVKALFPEVFMEYSIYILPLYIVLYAWAMPSLLIPAKHSGKGIKATLGRLANPMFICMIIGAVVGVTGLGKVLDGTVVTDIIDTAGSCMSPVAMILTGVTIAKIDIPKVVRSRGIYIASFLRLVVIPVALMPLIMLLPIDNSTALCALCALAMPLGLNPVVIPSGYGQDTSIAAGMAVISHALSIITLPLVFAIFSGLIA